ncbi:hypothetical protein KTH_42110 [Thermosporothrix hazakensis]|nr:hypothetical protein KTH_42110 [Thermosporothrix hazakensis]
MQAAAVERANNRLSGIICVQHDLLAWCALLWLGAAHDIVLHCGTACKEAEQKTGQKREFLRFSIASF